MFKILLRMTGFTLLLSGSTVLMALLAGWSLQSEIITDYHKQEGWVYPVMIHDSAHDVSLNLAGSRCFAAPPPTPEWDANRHQYQPGYYPEQHQINDQQAADALERLGC
jgi:hypothetical protein